MAKQDLLLTRNIGIMLTLMPEKPQLPNVSFSIPV